MAFLRRWLLLWLALILGGGQILAAGTRENRDYTAAVKNFNVGMYDRAEAGFRQFADRYKNSTNVPMAVLLEAQAQFKQGKFTNAIALLASRRNQAGSLADQYFNWIGEAQFTNRNYSAAASNWVLLVKNYPQSSLCLSATVAAAAAYAQLGDWRDHDTLLESTNGFFQHAVQLDPGNELVVDGQLSRENSKYRQHDFPGAVAVYELLTNQWPTLNQGQQFQGTQLFYLANMELGDFAAALAAATNLVQTARSPTNQDWLATAWSSQGAVLLAMGRTNEAMTAYRQNLAPGVPVTDQHESVLKIAGLALAQGDLTNAEAMLGKFLGQFPFQAGSELARLTLGELYLKDYIAHPAAAGQLVAAQANFDQFVGAFTNSPLAGRAYLDRGWSEWFAGQTNAALADFEMAAHRLPPSEELAVAKFKTGDALFAQGDFSGAQTSYQAVLDDFPDLPSVNAGLGGRALYQIVRADLALEDITAAGDALARLLQLDSTGEFAQGSALLFGEDMLDPRQAREEVFQKTAWQPALRAPVALAVARTYEQEQDWPAAITNYEGWLAEFPTNSLRPQAEFALAWADFQAGNEADALALFANFGTRFPAETNLAPQAQWWVADHFFRAGNFVGAETNYELIFQTPAWKNSTNLVYQAQLMAGRSAMARQDFPDAVHFYFTPLISDTNCPEVLRVQARFAWGAALMQMPSTDTNNPLANFSAATNYCFGPLTRDYPTNEYGVRAWGETGDCDIQLNDFDAATNAYAQVFSTNSPADVSARSAAEIAFGLALEKKAALAGADRTNLLGQALDSYLDVFRKTNNLRDGEKTDDYWVKYAGLRAALLVGTLYDATRQKFFYGELGASMPALQESLARKIAALPVEKN